MACPWADRLRLPWRRRRLGRHYQRRRGARTDCPQSPSSGSKAMTSGELGLLMPGEPEGPLPRLGPGPAGAGPADRLGAGPPAGRRRRSCGCCGVWSRRGPARFDFRRAAVTGGADALPEAVGCRQRQRLSDWFPGFQVGGELDRAPDQAADRLHSRIRLCRHAEACSRIWRDSSAPSLGWEGSGLPGPSAGDWRIRRACRPSQLRERRWCRHSHLICVERQRESQRLVC